MITINYIGQFGNRMFQYSYARLLAEYNKINLLTELGCDNIVKTTPHKQFDEPAKKGTKMLTDTGYDNFRQKNGSIIVDLDPSYDYIIDGYFQDAELFNKYEEQVRSFFIIPKINKNYDDTLVLFRLGDFIHNAWNSEIIHYNWYNEAISQMPGKKIFVTSSNKSENGPSTKEQEMTYFSKISSFNGELIEAKGTKEDFEYIYSFDNIISSNSTWSWWACFLSRSTNIITMEQFGSFGTNILKSHGVHINKLYNIRNISKVIPGEFIDITLL